jgi:hypothetical protein
MALICDQPFLSCCMRQLVLIKMRAAVCWLHVLGVLGAEWRQGQCLECCSVSWLLRLL